MAKNKKKIVIIIFAAILGISIISVGVVKAVNKKDDNEMFVTTVKVEEEPLNSDIISNGIIKSKEQRNIVTNLPYTIEEVLVEEGDEVSTGDSLVRLDTKDLEHMVKTAEINLEMEKDALDNMLDKEDTFQLEKNLENSKLTYENAKKKHGNSQTLFDTGAISKVQLEADEVAFITAKNNYELVKKQLDDISNGKNDKSIESQKKKIQLQELNLKSQKEDLEKSIIKSPIDGTVIYSNAKVGIPATSGNPLFIIDDTDNLEIEVNISEYDINDIKIEQKVKITGDAFKDKEFDGKVAYIAPIAEVRQTNGGVETNVKIKVDILDITKDLKPGFSADVSIRTKHKENSMVVPYEVIYQKKDGSNVVFKVVEGKAKEIPVEIGIKGDIKLEIISDEINKGDEIILNPTEKYEDGMNVKIINTGDKK